jgi:hypothetical protein
MPNKVTSKMNSKTEAKLMDILDEKKMSAAHETDLSAEELSALDDAMLAMTALQDWAQDEPIQAREDFWPRLREKLPPSPPRSAWRRTLGVLGAWLWPAHAPIVASMRVAVLAAIIALATFWFAPQQAITPLAADFSPEETAFIQRSLQQHDNYVATGPADGSFEIPAGDASSVENGESEPNVEYVP